jgi:hypothetical protein
MPEGKVQIGLQGGRFGIHKACFPTASISGYNTDLVLLMLHSG